jgi:hypothetical protein
MTEESTPYVKQNQSDTHAPQGQTIHLCIGVNHKCHKTGNKVNGKLTMTLFLPTQPSLWSNFKLKKKKKTIPQVR